MNCPKCGADTGRVRETRELAQGYVLRRARTCKNGHKFATYEVDDSIAKTILKHAAGPQRIEKFKKSAQRYERDQRIIARLESGEKHAVVAAEFGLSDNMVSTIARRSGVQSLRSVLMDERREAA